MRAFTLPKRSRCRRCPFRAASGKCLDPTPRTGRCGDWVYYPVGSKQHRRRYIKPKDPRTPNQLRWRKRLGDASRAYSAGLSDGQQDACIAAGSKVKSRPRFGQWGWLTGSAVSRRRESARRRSVRRRKPPAEGKIRKPYRKWRNGRRLREPHGDSTRVAPE